MPSHAVWLKEPSLTPPTSVTRPIFKSDASFAAADPLSAVLLFSVVLVLEPPHATRDIHIAAAIIRAVILLFILSSNYPLFCGLKMTVVGYTIKGGG